MSELMDNGKYHYQRELQTMTIPTLTKYFSDGRIETWITDDNGDEIYLLRVDYYPGGKSPIVELDIDRSLDE